MNTTKWRVTIPPPKSKRMDGNGLLIIEKSQGWGSVSYDRYKIDSSTTEMTFEVNSIYESIHSTSIIDGNYFRVTIKYTNQSGSREESFELIPEKLTN